MRNLLRRIVQNVVKSNNQGTDQKRGKRPLTSVVNDKCEENFISRPLTDKLITMGNLLGRNATLHNDYFTQGLTLGVF